MAVFTIFHRIVGIFNEKEVNYPNALNYCEIFLISLVVLLSSSLFPLGASKIIEWGVECCNTSVLVQLMPRNYECPVGENIWLICVACDT